jgi:cytochrome b
MTEGQGRPVRQAIGDAAVRQVVWDVAVRLVHWSLLLLVALAWWTAASDDMTWHRRCGLAILALLLFRLGWGLIGSQTARFANFLRGPRRVASYARSLLHPAAPAPVTVGHNPLGGWSVVLLLGTLLGQCGLGLFAVDTDGLESGPLAGLVSFESGRWAAHWHHRLFTLLQALVGLHVAAVTFYALARRDNLLTPMITGRKALPDGVAPPRLGSPLSAVLLALLALATVLLLSRGRDLLHLTTG